LNGLRMTMFYPQASRYTVYLGNMRKYNLGIYTSILVYYRFFQRKIEF
jgi:hypothetical protein